MYRARVLKLLKPWKRSRFLQGSEYSPLFSFPITRQVERIYQEAPRTFIVRRLYVRQEGPVRARIWSQMLLPGQKKTKLLSLFTHVPFDSAF